MNNGCLGFPRRTSGAANEVGPDLAIVAADGTVWARIVVDADNEDVFIGAGDDAQVIIDGDTPLIRVGSGGVQVRGGTDGATYVNLNSTTISLNGSDGVTTGSLTVGPAGVSMNGGSGIDGSDTVADATDNASAILRLNELLAVLRDLGVLA